jgi:hypothetical protein
MKIRPSRSKDTLPKNIRFSALAGQLVLNSSKQGFARDQKKLINSANAFGSECFFVPNLRDYKQIEM